MTRLRAAWVTHATVGVRGGAQDPDAAAGVLDHGKDVQERAGQRHRLDEVGGQQPLGLRA
jgi:hypothetical protein